MCVDRHGVVSIWSTKCLVIVSIAFIMTAFVHGHVPWVNGPWYWKWPWRNIDEGHALPPLLLAVLPFFAAQILYGRKTVTAAHALAMIMASLLALQLAGTGVQTTPFSLSRVSDVVESTSATSYFTEASTLAKSSSENDLRNWLASYPDRMRNFHLHAINKPPGLILYYIAFISLFGDTHASFAGGLFIGGLATLSIPTTFLLVRRLTGDDQAAFHAASYLALCPGLVLFFPEFDQCYPSFTFLLLATWSLALDRNSVLQSIVFGVALSVVLFFTYNLLVLGVFIVGYGAIALVRRDRSMSCAQLLTHAVAATLIITVIYGSLWVVTGFNGVQTFFTAVRNQAEYFATTRRPEIPYTIPFDVLDFALGSGWISFILVGFFLVRGKREKHPSQFVVHLAVFQILIVAGIGILPGETARVWIFLLPLLMIPIGLELSRWGLPARLAVYGSLWLLLTAICQNMLFIGV